MLIYFYVLIYCSDEDDDLAEYDLEHYDDEVDEAAGDTMAMFGNANNLVFHENDEDDPYITMQGAEDEEGAQPPSSLDARGRAARVAHHPRA